MITASKEIFSKIETWIEEIQSAMTQDSKNSLCAEESCDWMSEDVSDAKKLTYIYIYACMQSF